MKKIVFSGIRPSGRLHIGNYLGAIKSWLKLQETHQCIFAVVDYHGITTPFNQKTLQKDIFNVILDYLAVGLDPKKSMLIIQSQVPAHTELAWILNTITPVSWLERCPTYKEKKLAHPEYVNMGLLDYPVLMAADILLYKATDIPIGQDQLPHLELTKEIAKKFNRMFGQTFPIPRAILSQGARIMSLTDPSKKMSKTGQEGIDIADSPELIQKKLATAVTDLARKRRTDKGHPAKCNLFSLHQLFSGPAQIKKISQACQTAQIGCLECKKILGENIAQELAPFRQKRTQLEKNPVQIKKILEASQQKAQKIAQKNMREVKSKMGLI